MPSNMENVQRGSSRSTRSLGRGRGRSRGRGRPTRSPHGSTLNAFSDVVDVTRPLEHIRPIHTSSITQPVAEIAKQPPTEQRSANPTTNTRHFSERRFADAPISEKSKMGLKHEFMTDVQAATLGPALTGKDLLVQARTGTGKTIAFLLPAIERLLVAPARLGISILVLSPTRELALQIEKEAETLISHHDFKVQHAIGGTNQTSESRRLLQSTCDILIATPGRLLDHLRSSILPQKLSNLKIIVYDEADRLLDQGFSRDLKAILNYLPPRHTRQALLFSATVSQDIKEIAAAALRPGYSFITTLLEDEVNIHEHVEQGYILSPQRNFMETMVGVLRQDFEANRLPSQYSEISTSKCMVFFPTARQVSFATELLSKISGLPPIFEIHSRKTQSARTNAAEQFKTATSAILLSSDVAARGVDFPGVTLVLQVGLPASTEQYIHRLGRTARAGAAGRGIIILSPEEEFFLRKPEMVELGLKPSPISTPSKATIAAISRAVYSISSENKAQAYRAFLGYYNTYAKAMRMSKEQIVQFAWSYAVDTLGWSKQAEPPGIDPRTVAKMNLKGVPGLNIQSKPPLVRPPRPFPRSGEISPGTT